ncbi:hypothetical protein AAVH_13205 [Aphelenchoides avenae]|nr:hypothetical protein AAVH_13205 [Aphelenchus avenae]
MDARERTENSHHHKELKKEEPHDNEGYGRVTFIANALLSEAGGIEREDVVVTIESSGDEADVPGPSGMRNGKTAANGTAHVGTPSMPPTTITPNENGLYACQDCHKTFAGRDVLLLHATAPHMYACNMCAFKTTTAKHLKRHGKKFCKKWRDRAERDARLGQSTEPKKLWVTMRERRKRKGADAALLAGLQTCWRCSAVFRDKQSLDEHIRDSHEDAALKPPPRAVD